MAFKILRFSIFKLPYLPVLTPNISQYYNTDFHQKQPSRSFLQKRSSDNMQENFAKQIALRHEYSPINLLHIFRKLFPKTTYGRLLLCHVSSLN